MKWLVSSPQKLAGFLQSQFGGIYSGKQLRRALEANLCRVNGQVERFASTSLKRGDRVELAPAWKALLAPARPSFQVLFEDEFLKVVDKPANWVCNEAFLRKSFGPHHYLVHRLDKDTTGILLLAKTIPVRDRLMELFETREVKKEYLALVDGIPPKDGGRIENFLAKKRAFEGQTIWGSAHSGLTAITDWEKLSSGSIASLILCKPYTGRTHQLRVHLAEMGHPILVDRQYAKHYRCRQFFPRPLLHAHRLQFLHPFTQKEIDLTADLPEDMKQVLEVLKLQHPF